MVEASNVAPSHTLLPTPAFRSYFEIFNGHGKVDAHSLENILLLVGISLTPAQVEDALMSADIDGERPRLHLESRAGPASQTVEGLPLV